MTQGESTHPKTISASSFIFRPTIRAAMVDASAIKLREITKDPMIFRLDTNCTSGITANGNCIDRITWLSTSKPSAMMGPSLMSGASADGSVRRQPWLMDCEIK